jgi:hypothetical protein
LAREHVAGVKEETGLRLLTTLINQGGELGRSLQQVARLIKADAGVEAAFAEIGGWDHHVNELGQRANDGPLANLLREYGAGTGSDHPPPNIIWAITQDGSRHSVVEVLQEAISDWTRFLDQKRV